MVNVTDDTGPNGKRGDFEATVAYLLPKDPVVKRKNQDDKCSVGKIADVTAKVSDFGSKPGTIPQNPLNTTNSTRSNNKNFERRMMQRLHQRKM